jgi:hypothetical protein
MIYFNLILIFIILILLLSLFVVNSNSKQEHFTLNKKPKNNTSKKIALCFLIYDKINHEELWNAFLKQVDTSKYNIYIHFKEDKQLKFFNNNKLNKTVKTKWCGDSLVEAQLLLLDEAIRDQKNQHFVFVSNSCLPVKSFNYIYDTLDTNKSYFNMAIPYVKKFAPNINAFKSSQWCILNRKHTELLLKNKQIIRETYKLFKKQHVRGCPDEYSIISSLKALEKNVNDNLITTDNLSIDATTFTGWQDMKNYKNFSNTKKKGQPDEFLHISPEQLDYFIKSKSLFARKFNENCTGLEKLSNIY